MKNLGITKACIACKKTLFRDLNFIGTGSLKFKCPHCGAHVVIELKQKPFVTVSLIVGAMVFIGLTMVFWGDKIVELAIK
jgi:predicted RNA-binding Zn-ribbon protein involved in translation (DUF1610 family)